MNEEEKKAFEFLITVAEGFQASARYAVKHREEAGIQGLDPDIVEAALRDIEKTAEEIAWIKKTYL